MAHWEHRQEPKWKQFAFKQPYSKGLKRLKEEVLAKTDFDPSTLWQWGTMQAMALIGVLRNVEAKLGAEGQQVVADAIRNTGLDVGRQILDHASIRRFPPAPKPATSRSGNRRTPNAPR